MKPFVLIALLGMTVPAGAHPDPRHTLAEIDHHLAASPDDPGLLLRKAELLFENRLFKYARAVTNKALRIAPDQPDLLLLAARLCEATGDTGAALQQAAEITRRFPGHPAARSFIARLHHQAGHIDEAIREKLLQLDATSAVGPGDFLIAAAWLRDRDQPQDRQQAITVLDRAISRFGLLTGLQQAAIDLECSIGQHDAALRRIDAMIRKSGPAVTHSLARAGIYEQTRRFEQAAAACDSALALLDLDPSADPTIRRQILERKQLNVSKAEP